LTGLEVCKWLADSKTGNTCRLRNVSLPEKVRDAIDEKISAEQRAQQMVFVLQKERQEAESKGSSLIIRL